ncbi:MAG: hypothetical protein R3325_10010 [Thermoanaerobaculia bacterium]|nr:hypothetical protein [Thermoanaerobaculia bacterium]
MSRGRRAGPLLPLLVVAAAAEAETVRVPARGTVAGQPVATTVDSVAAAYYLESYLGEGKRQAGLHQAIDRALAEAPDPADREALRRLAARFSTDFATLYFVHALDGVERNRRARESYRAILTRLPTEGVPTELVAAHRDTLFVFVPGYGYRLNPATGADFARQRRLMEETGFATRLVETDEQGTVEGNARIVAAALERLAADRRSVVVVSTSKGGAEAALALGGGLPPEAAWKVRAWISVGGLLRGSPYADRALRSGLMGLVGRAFLLFRGLPREMVASLSTARRRAAFEALALPDGLLAVQFVGVPLSGQVSPDVRRRYRAIRPEGPNDGLTLLADELVPGGVAIAELGLDHYYRDPSIDEKGLALVVLVLESLEGRGGSRGRDRSSEPIDPLPGLGGGGAIPSGAP